LANRFRFPDFRKELAGGAAAVALFAGGLATGIPAVFAGAAAAAGFWALWTLVPRRKESRDIVLAPGVNEESLDAFLSDCSAAAGRIDTIRSTLAAEQMRKQAEELSAVIRRILDDCREDPSDIRVEPQLPALLAMLASMLERYAEIAPRARPGAQSTPQLGQIEEAVSTSLRWLLDLEQRMLHNDIADGAAQAQTLIQVMKAQLEDPMPPREDRR